MMPPIELPVSRDDIDAMATRNSHALNRVKVPSLYPGDGHVNWARGELAEALKELERQLAE